MKRSIHLYLLMFAVFYHGCSSKNQESTDTGLGIIDFEVSSNSPQAVDHFERGVLWLHSFMYEEAAQSFRLAQESDPDFALAYWGEVMTYNHPLWLEQNYEKAAAALKNLAPTSEARIEKAQTTFEKDIFKAAEILYGEGDKVSRDDAYAEYMAELNQKYPDNHEVAAFHALALLGSVEEGRDYIIYGKAAAIAQRILDENPKHPGALHYLIHSYDDPNHASLAVEAADNYSKVAPDAGHALHMPSHIYIALGRWDDVIASNIRSFEASLKKIEEDSASRWNLHAYHWLMYGHLQQGELDEADRIMKNLTGYIKSDQSDYARAYFIDMLGNYSAETGQWNHEYNLIQVSDSDLNVISRVGQAFISGMGAVENKKFDQAENIISEMETEMQNAQNKLVSKGITVCSGVSTASRAPSRADLDQAKVLTLILKAKLAVAEDKNDEHVEAMLKEAVALEISIPFLFGPPQVYLPSYEAYGEWLIKKGRYEESIFQFKKSLEKGPGRSRALGGIDKAEKQLASEKLTERS